MTIVIDSNAVVALVTKDDRAPAVGRQMKIWRDAEESLSRSHDDTAENSERPHAALSPARDPVPVEQTLTNDPHNGRVVS